MRIQSIKVKPLEIPFKLTFKHATAERRVTESVLVIAESESGNIGYGEGCPRSYVTGEDIPSVLSFVKRHRSDIQKIHDLDALKVWIEKEKETIDVHPAAWCAVELAILDLLGKEQRLMVESLLGLPRLAGKFHYTAVLGTSAYKAFEIQLRQYLSLGFKDFKMKVSGDLNEDIKKLRLLEQRQSQGLRIRLDANNLWDQADEAITYMKQLGASFFAIEEPIKANQYSELRRIAKKRNTKIILDESFIKKEQFLVIKADPDHWIINLRISKMGGILRSLAIAKEAKERKIEMILGAQVGETSILTRAALVIANAYRENLLAQEGAFGTHLLKKDLIDSPIMFGNQGILDIGAFPQLTPFGFGLTKLNSEWTIH